MGKPASNIGDEKKKKAVGTICVKVSGNNRELGGREVAKGKRELEWGASEKNGPRRGKPQRVAITYTYIEQKMERNKGAYIEPGL